MIKWDSKLSIGIKKFDEHHKELIEIINELSEAVMQHEKHYYLKNILFELIHYTKYHFSAEERLMTKHNYEDYDKHKDEHHKLTAQVEKFIEEYSTGSERLDDSLLEFLKKWLVEHILDTDKKFGIYLQRKGLN